MSIVYVLGAGASFGERLMPLENCPEFARSVSATPPLISGFFKGSLFEGIRYSGEMAEKDFPQAFEYIRFIRLLGDAVGKGAWENLNIEEVFTSIELEREFRSADSDAGARLVIIRNQLIRYIWRIIALCCEYKFAEYMRSLCHALRPDDSIVSFNWDLLLDQEFRSSRAANPQDQNARWHDYVFRMEGLGTSMTPAYSRAETEMSGSRGMFLQLHGSLNWLQCTNARCPGSSQLYFDGDVQACLHRATGILEDDETCRRCGADTVPLLIPPLLRKPITENWIIRSAWGHARRRLLQASKAVLVGFAGAGTDFYATWLLRSTLGLRDDVEIFVVDPANDPAVDTHTDFSRRMHGIFLKGYNDEFHTISQIDTILERALRY